MCSKNTVLNCWKILKPYGYNVGIIINPSVNATKVEKIVWICIWLNPKCKFFNGQSAAKSGNRKVQRSSQQGSRLQAFGSRSGTPHYMGDDMICTT